MTTSTSCCISNFGCILVAKRDFICCGTLVSCGNNSTHLVKLSAKTLKNVMLVDLENRLALVEDSVHDNAQWVHVRGGVAADGQDVFRRQVLWVGEAEWRLIGLPLFARVLGLQRTREHNQVMEDEKTYPLTTCPVSGTNLSLWGVGGWDAKVKAHDLPRSALVEDDVFWTQVSVDHFHSAVQERQTLRDLDGKSKNK